MKLFKGPTYKDILNWHFQSKSKGPKKLYYCNILIKLYFLLLSCSVRLDFSRCHICWHSSSGLIGACMCHLMFTIFWVILNIFMTCKRKNLNITMICLKFSVCKSLMIWKWWTKLISLSIKWAISVISNAILWCHIKQLILHVRTLISCVREVFNLSLCFELLSWRLVVFVFKKMNNFYRLW